jgi:hypothetical protein
VTTESTPTPNPMIRLHKASLVLQLLAAHPELAAAPIDWEIDDRTSGLWPRVKYEAPETRQAAEALADALGADMSVNDVNGRPMYCVYGTWQGTEVNLQAFGPKATENAEVSA